jgi:hypothetical protein
MLLSGAGLDVRQFSYLGLTSTGNPIPHGANATNQPLDVIADRLAAQIDALATQAHQPISLVAESEGSLVALAYLHRYSDAPVSHLVLLSPIIDPGRVDYPHSGHEGFGVASGWALRGVVGLVDAISPFAVSADGPLLHSIDDEGTLLSLSTWCRPDVRAIAFVPLADTVTLPAAFASAVPLVVLPAFHGGLLGSRDVALKVAAYLRGDPPTSSSALSEVGTLIGDASAAWRVPPLVRTASHCG